MTLFPLKMYFFHKKVFTRSAVVIFSHLKKTNSLKHTSNKSFVCWSTDEWKSESTQVSLIQGRSQKLGYCVLGGGDNFARTTKVYAHSKWMNIWKDGCINELMNECIHGCFNISSICDWLTDWLTDWLSDWLTGWLTEWLTDWLSPNLGGGRAASPLPPPLWISPWLGFFG